MKLLLTFALSLLTFVSFSQAISVLTSGTKTSLRGLCVVDDNVLWASGSNGTVARSLDGGKTFTWLTVAGYEQRDFRDVEAFDANTAIIMAVAEPAIILKTKDGGKTWKKVFEDSTKGMFLDAMDFTKGIGVVVGDPINGKIYMASTIDSGNTWENITAKDYLMSQGTLKPVDSGEAMFASSGTNIKIISDMSYFDMHSCIYITGGKVSSFIKSDKFKLPLLQGKESTGANSIAINSKNKIVIVGGDFANDKDTTGNCVLTSDFGKTWIYPQTSPHGYRSCVAFIDQHKLITCGTSGVDISNDGGNNWTLISPESFHVCQKAKSGEAVFLAGKDGRIAKLDYE